MTLAITTAVYLCVFLSALMLAASLVKHGQLPGFLARTRPSQKQSDTQRSTMTSMEGHKPQDSVRVIGCALPSESSLLDNVETLKESYGGLYASMVLIRKMEKMEQQLTNLRGQNAMINQYLLSQGDSMGDILSKLDEISSGRPLQQEKIFRFADIHRGVSAKVALAPVMSEAHMVS